MQLGKGLSKTSKKIIEAQMWFQLRKKSVVAHWAWGVLSALTLWQFGPMGVFLIILFGLFEYWNDIEQAKRSSYYKFEGCTDFWDMMVGFGISYSIILGCHLAGVLTIHWL